MSREEVQELNGFNNTFVDESIKKNNNAFNLPSDDDSVCADIDHWACSSLEDSSSQINEANKLRELELEQQRLNESVFALSTHFAHIQFRIQQINKVAPDERDAMFKELQEFASKGCIDINEIKRETEELQKFEKENKIDVKEKKTKVVKLIKQLRAQLEDLENFAYENGQGDLPINELKERQKLVFDKLQEKMCFKIELDKFSKKEQLQKSIEEELEQILNPIREKEKLITQLQTQITDLERYVSFLQDECIGLTSNNYSDNFSILSSNNTKKLDNLKVIKEKDEEIKNIETFPSLYKKISATLIGNSKGIQAVSSKSFNVKDNYEQKTLPLLVRWFGCGKVQFEKNELKNSLLCNHYGDQRARLELAVDYVLQILQKYQILTLDRSERETLPIEELNEAIFECSEEAIVAVVRKDFCSALKNLLEHGMKETIESDFNLVLDKLKCASSNQQSSYAKNMKLALKKFDGKSLTHIWDIIQIYYEVSRILEIKNEAIGRLTDAFKLPSINGKTATSKQVLLTTIENVQNTHIRLQRSNDAMWKAFVSAALNHNRLPGWIRIIFRSNIILKKCYNSWSYVARTGCEDIQPLLERLHQYNFDLPVDLAVRPFEHIKEAF